MDMQGVGNIVSNLVQKRIEMRKLIIKFPEQHNFQLLNDNDNKFLSCFWVSDRNESLQPCRSYFK